MTSSRSKVRIRRTSIIGALGGGSFIFAFVRYGIVETGHQLPHHSLFFGSMAHWAPFFRSFMPLDWAVTCLSVGAVFYLLLASMGGGADQNVVGFRGWVRMMLGVFVGSGSLCAACMAGIFGWYSAIETFIVGGTAMSLLVGVLFLLGNGLDAVALRGAKWWQSVRDKTCFRPLVRLGEFLSASDVPD